MTVTMPDVLICSVVDTFQVSGRGLIVAPFFPVDANRFDKDERVRVEPPEGDSFECKAFFQIPHQTPPANVLSYHCALLEVSKENVPVGSKIWLLEKAKHYVTSSGSQK
jgi:hypothetical protein